MRLTALALLIVAGCGKWTDVVQPADGTRATGIKTSNGAACISVMIHGQPDERMRLSEALTMMCDALLDPILERFITDHLALLDSSDRAMIEQTSVNTYLAPWSLGDPAFHIIPDKLSSPGLSEICVGGHPGVRAVGIDRAQRLTSAAGPKAAAILVNTLAHETIHLYPLDQLKQPCLDRFNDRSGHVKQCHEFTYVVGNAAACSFLSRQSGWDGDWQRCMTEQADNTPGHQPARTRDAFGCASQSADVTTQ